jgi:hypothetical protein
MNTEDDEFNRIESQAKARMMAVQYALDRSQILIPLPITEQELDKVLKKNALQQLHNENKRLGLYDGVYEPSPIPLITDEEWAALNKEKE